jgi:predicted ArsR family transcriptional regulator
MSQDRERNDQGQYVGTLSLEDVIEAIRQTDSPIATAKELSELLDCSSEAARQKLITLHEQGRVERRTVGANAVVWWLTDTEDTVNEINPDDPFWSAEPHAGDEPVGEDDIDNILYGEVKS